MTDDHVYHVAGTYSVEIDVTDGYSTTSTTGTATINDSTIMLSGGVKEGAVKGTSVTGTWASFTDTNLLSTADSYTTSINWPTATATGTVTGSDGAFIISSTPYASAGPETVTVTLTDADGTTATVNSTAQVGDIYAGVSTTLTVATFTVSDTTLTTGDVTATINWGDGTSSIGTVTGSSGVFTVEGTHLYTTNRWINPTASIP